MKTHFSVDFLLFPGYECEDAAFFFPISFQQKAEPLAVLLLLHVDSHNIALFYASLFEIISWKKRNVARFPSTPVVIFILCNWISKCMQGIT